MKTIKDEFKKILRSELDRDLIYAKHESLSYDCFEPVFIYNGAKIKKVKKKDNGLLSSGATIISSGNNYMILTNLYINNNNLGVICVSNNNNFEDHISKLIDPYYTGSENFNLLKNLFFDTIYNSEINLLNLSLFFILSYGEQYTTRDYIQNEILNEMAFNELSSDEIFSYEHILIIFIKIIKCTSLESISKKNKLLSDHGSYYVLNYLMRFKDKNKDEVLDMI